MFVICVSLTEMSSMNVINLFSFRLADSSTGVSQMIINVINRNMYLDYELISFGDCCNG